MYYTSKILPTYTYLPDLHALRLESIIRPTRTSPICSLGSCPLIDCRLLLHGDDAGPALTL
jgi:hypothetical protein